jgi:murein DD-endopeptidase MepM/ murein hydrolase activator NlpD
MAGLLKPVASATIGQRFDGHASGSAFWYQNLGTIVINGVTRPNPLAAFKYKFPGYSGYSGLYHGAIDYQAPTGTSILAAERSKVIQFGTDPYSGNDKYVFLEISPHTATRERVRIENWHLKSFAAGLYVGKVVARGAVVGYVDTTGWATGSHDHFVLKMLERDPDLVWREYVYNPLRFLTGGDLAADARIRPYY